jgi:hypothetical protein
LLFQVIGQLAAEGGFTATLQACNQDHGRRAFGIELGGFRSPIRCTSSSFTIFTINWLGEMALITFSPEALSFTLSVNSLAIL